MCPFVWPFVLEQGYSSKVFKDFFAKNCSLMNYCYWKKLKKPLNLENIEQISILHILVLMSQLKDPYTRGRSQKF